MKKVEYTVSGIDILNLVANIDERQDEVKSISKQWEEEHPKEEEPDYKNISLPIINQVVYNILNHVMTGRKLFDNDVEFVVTGGNMFINKVDDEPLGTYHEPLESINLLINRVVKNILKKNWLRNKS